MRYFRSSYIKLLSVGAFIAMLYVATLIVSSPKVVPPPKFTYPPDYIHTCKKDLKPFSGLSFDPDKTPTFQMVKHLELWVSSAVFDRRHKTHPHRIQIIGISTLQFELNILFCTVWYDKSTVLSVKASNKAMYYWPPIHKHFGHLAYFFYCDMKMEKAPKMVSLGFKPCDNQPNLLQIKDLQPYPSNGPLSIAHCLPTIHGEFHPLRLLEWFTLQRILGIDHVFLYDFQSISKDVYNVIDYFRKEGFLTVIRWHIPDDMSIHGYGIHSVINDCVYRAYGKYKYVASYDFDEFIVPLKGQSLKEFILKYDKMGVTSLSFNSAYFCMKSNPVYVADQRLLTQKYFSMKIAPIATVNKMITKPEATLELNIHSVEQPAPGYRLHGPYIGDALCYHYRYLNDHIGDHKDNCNKTDTTLVMYAKPLLKGVNKVLSQLGMSLITQ